MKTVRAAVRPGTYLDSVVLMRLQRSLAALPGVDDAGAVMATPANLELLAAAGLDPGEAAAARADDLLVVLRAESAQVAEAAIARIDELLGGGGGPHGDELPRTRSLRTAARRLPAAAWVAISVPGAHAAAVAHEALDLGRHVFLFSDNVPLADEVELKRRAAEIGKLVMGPDCGTAMIAGVGLGFANRVRRGPIGLVAASGTGAQAVACAVDDAGSGISHIIGTGGRDLSRAVGGATAIQALDLLCRDDGTEVIIMISKPPDPSVAATLLSRAVASPKPVVACFLGAPTTVRRVGALWRAVDLGDAAALAVALAAAPPYDAVQSERRDRPFVRGLFSGGTLAQEAVLTLGKVVPQLSSNLDADGVEALTDPMQSIGHTVVDLGADELTAGRPHPMIDPQLVVDRLRREADDPEVGFILLDVVLGDGAHQDPASLLEDDIGRAVGLGIDVVVAVIGSGDDPQDSESQREKLEAAGARVYRSSGGALASVVRRIAEPPPAVDVPVALDALERPAVINVGLEIFQGSLAAQGVEVVQVDWRPPAGGDDKLAAILAGMKGGT